MDSDFKLLAPSDRASLAAKFALNNVSLSHDGPQCERETKYSKGDHVMIAFMESDDFERCGTVLETKPDSVFGVLYFIGLDNSQKRVWAAEGHLELFPAAPVVDPNPSSVEVCKGYKVKPSAAAVDRILADMADPVIATIQHTIKVIEVEIADCQDHISHQMAFVRQLYELLASYRASKLAQPNPNEQEEKEKKNG